MADFNLYLVLACVFGFFMAWGVGANDVANAMGTSVGSRALTIKQAILIAAVFEFLGAYFAGGAVTQTISKGIVDISYFQNTPDLFIFGMLASLLAAGLWLMIASFFGWPVSTTHTIVGAIIGFTVAGIGAEAVHWWQVVSIVMSWVISPLFGAVTAYILFVSTQILIFNSPTPLQQAKRFIPCYIMLACFVIAMVTLTQGLKHIGLELTFLQSFTYASIFSLIMMGVGYVIMYTQKLETSSKSNRRTYIQVEKTFAILMGFTACAMAFAHGSNDVANAVGPIAAVHAATVMHTLGGSSETPPWILLLGGVGIIAGLVMYGHRVIQTIGSGITELTPSRGFAATLGATTTVVFASGMGLPISTTHTLVGSVLGVGMARGIGALNLQVVRSIATSWLVTLPAGALLAIVLFYLLRLIL